MWDRVGKGANRAAPARIGLVLPRHRPKLRSFDLTIRPPAHAMASEDNSTTAALKTAKDGISAAWGLVRREYARRGADIAVHVAVGSLDPQLDEALDLLAGRTSLVTAPWHAAKSWLSEPPEIFNIIAVREWVGTDVVRAATKRIVIAQIGGIEPDPVDEQMVVDVYVERTLNHPRMAADAIAQLHNFLALSINRFLSVGEAAILSQTRQQTEAVRTDVAGVATDIAELRGKLDALQKAQAQHDVLPTDYADRELRAELNLSLRRRHLADIDFSAEIGVLVERVTSGNLQAATPPLRAEPIRRMARIAASNGDIVTAETWLVQARKIDQASSLLIEEAWLTAAKGDVAKATATLWNHKDPEHQSALLAIIKHYRGSPSALTWLNDSELAAEDLTGAALVLVINMLLESGHWELADQWARGASADQRRDAPVLEALSGVTATLTAIPAELRQVLLDQDLLPFFDLRSVAFRQDLASRASLTGARQHFEKAATEAAALGARRAANHYDDLALWLAFQDDATRGSAEQTVATSMQDDILVFRRVRFALSYGIHFNRSALEAEIERREKLDATTAETVAADLVLAVHAFKAAPANLAAFIARKRGLLLRHFNPKALACIEIEALAKAGHAGSALSVLNNSRELFPEPVTLQRLEAIIAEAGGADPVATRRATYESSGNALADLHALIDALRQREDWRELHPLARELYRREGTLSAALLVCKCCRETRDDSALSDFLSRIGALTDQSPELQSALAWDHYRQGQLKLAKQLNDQLRSTRTHQDDRSLAINVAVESGDWSALHVIVEDDWGHRANLSAEDLISLARLAFEIGSDRMLALAELAVSKAPKDPVIHLNAWLLANQSGHLAGNSQAARWFETAVRNSGDDGPLKAVSMRELVEGQPRRHERNQRIADGIYDASIPLFIGADKLGVPLTELIAGSALANAKETDGRRVIPIHTFHGGRGRVPLGSVKCIGLDVTSIIVLVHLGLLRATVKAFERIVIPAGTLSHLLTDRQHIRVRQPALIKEAERLQALINNGDLMRMDNPAQVSSLLAKEIGHELAELIATAERDGGIVVAPAPIHKLESFMEVEANTSLFAHLLSDTRTILQHPVLTGILDAATKQLASTYLGHQDRGWPSPIPINAGKPIYLTGLAATYLATAELLPLLSRINAPVFISREADQHAKNLIKGNELLQPLLKLIDDARNILADAIASDRIVIGPRAISEELSDELRSHPTMALDRAIEMMDAIAIDDRAMNRHLRWSAPDSDRHTPIVCTLDIIDRLCDDGHITQAERDSCYYRLRRAGFSATPIAPDELLRLIKAAHTGDHIVETAELRAVRESITRVLAFQSIRLPFEATLLQGLRFAAISSIRELWTQAGNSGATIARANWLLDLLPNPHSLTALPPKKSDMEYILEMRASEIALLAMPLFEAPDFMNEYGRWIDDAVVTPLRQSDPNLLKRALRRIEHIVVDATSAAPDS